MSITLSSWNINGIRAVSAKEGFDWFRNTDYDVIGFQETKASAEQLSDELKNKPGYESFFCSSTVKKGYSGTAVFTRLKPLSVEFELPDEEFKGEGRIIHLEFEKFHFFYGYFQMVVLPYLMKTASLQVNLNVFLIKWAFLTVSSNMLRS